MFARHTFAKLTQACRTSLSQKHISMWKQSTKFQNIRHRLTETVQHRLSSSTVVPQQSSKMVGLWLLGVSGGVVGAVVIGGITRITRSGLSMTDWHLIRGMKPPRTDQEWDEEFTRYQDYPEFKLARSDMTLDEFKSIFFWEYVHRMWGRGIGLAFFIPAIAFWASKKLNPAMKKRTLLFGSLICGQGFLGYWMVKSGLDEATVANTAEPRVSQYRLAMHLGMAFLVYSGTFYNALSYLLKKNEIPLTKEVARVKQLSYICSGLVFLTAVSGAFVAGIDAGLVYNSFPMMANRWIPEDIAAITPAWRNIFENPTTTQFNHRILGTTTFLTVVTTWLLSRRAVLPPRARMAVNCLVAMGGMQVGLGISTLLLYVPQELAVTHQLGSLTLLSLAIWLQHELRHVKKVVK